MCVSLSRECVCVCDFYTMSHSRLHNRLWWSLLHRVCVWVCVCDLHWSEWGNQIDGSLGSSLDLINRRQTDGQTCRRAVQMRSCRSDLTVWHHRERLWDVQMLRKPANVGVMPMSRMVLVFLSWNFLKTANDVSYNSSTDPVCSNHRASRNVSSAFVRHKASSGVGAPTGNIGHGEIQPFLDSSKC